MKLYEEHCIVAKWAIVLDVDLESANFLLFQLVIITYHNSIDNFLRVESVHYDL